ncbi:MAG: hypothetical protein RL684_853 [Pseudomonadota bacterium]|jgi:hypothetical protein
MTTLASIKLSTNLVDAARADAAVFHRSIGGQVEHWANIGRAIEASPGYTLDRVRAALAGEFDAELLTVEERAFFDDLFGEDTAPTAAAKDFWATFKNAPNTDL